MSVLIFCSVEVGGFPYKMAEILNRHGIETYYVSFDQRAYGHDSTQFHYGNRREGWDLSKMFRCGILPDLKIKEFKQMKMRYNITHCLATGSKSYILSEAGINYKYWSYGADLDLLCFATIWPLNYPWPPNYPFWKKCIKFPEIIFITRRHSRYSLINAESVMITPYQLETFNLLCPDKSLFFLPHFLNTIDYNLLMKKKIQSKNEICEKIGAKHFLFSSVRHVWRGYYSKFSDNKGNDIILHSFAKYIKMSNDQDVKLVLVEKGPDVEYSKWLSQKLVIDKRIVWINEMKRDELNKYYQGATICFGQFATPAIVFSVLEPLSNATPCISSLDANKTLVPIYNDLPPVINSRNPDEIAKFIHEILTDYDYCTNLGYKSWLWIKNNSSEEKFIKSFCDIFNLTSY